MRIFSADYTNLSLSEKYLRTTIDLAAHFILTFILSLGFLYFTGKWSWVVLCVLGGIFIDIDHFGDHFLWNGLNFDFKKFFTSEHQISGKTYIILHSWELVFILFIAAIWAAWLTPLVVGMITHLFIDYLFGIKYGISRFSFFYKWHHNFDRIEKIKANYCQHRVSTPDVDS